MSPLNLNLVSCVKLTFWRWEFFYLTLVIWSYAAEQQGFKEVLKFSLTSWCCCHLSSFISEMSKPLCCRTLSVYYSINQTHKQTHTFTHHPCLALSFSFWGCLSSLCNTILNYSSSLLQSCAQDSSFIESNKTHSIIFTSSFSSQPFCLLTAEHWFWKINIWEIWKEKLDTVIY